MKNIRNSKSATLGLERVIKQQNEAMQQLTAGLQDALYSIAESLDFMAAKHASGEVDIKPTEIESAIIYEALKKHYLDSMKETPGEQAHEQAMLRIRHLANGGCFNA